jgi:hypothetical protein
MFPREQEGALPGPAARSSPREGGSEPSTFMRYAARRLTLLTAFVIVGFLLGIVARFLIDDPASRDVANYVRSGLHGSGIALTAWAAQTAFAAIARSRLGAALQRLPILGEIVVRSVVMTAPLIVVGVALQLMLHAEPLRLHWLTLYWFTTRLPWMITRFFFDIDEPIGDHVGAVHAYVGDEVIVTWPVSAKAYSRPEPLADAAAPEKRFDIRRALCSIYVLR